uniref:Protein kinase domain-containing protein n=1 Tax=Magnetococcus massalia (strain MO-1) TaxID=451514 RepID=A0A1S7LL09_MAGMO|nr:putative Protein kinase with WD40 repeats [Candidatus Magnetococcus massalia]
MDKVALCSHCGQAIRNVPAKFAGRTLSCPQCQKPFTIQFTDLAAQSTTAKQIAQTASNLLAGASEDDQDAGEEVPVEWQEGDRILGTYDVKRLLGVGGMGSVYLVRHLGWNRDLAVKSPKADILASTPGAAENFTMEAENWVKMGLHPNICSCYYVRELGGIPRLFAEFVDGGDLLDWIKGKKGEAPRLYLGSPQEALKRALDIAIQFAWGLEYAHKLGMTHQDIKPANVMMTPSGTPKVTDFGLSRMVAASSDSAGDSSEVESAGMSPRWCSPEQAAHAKVSPKTDMWSWALSVLCMFTTRPSWRRGTQAMNALDKYLAMDGKSDPTLRKISSMPATVVEMLRRCFHDDPAQRPVDMATLAEELSQIYAAEIGTPYPHSKPKMGRGVADSLNNQAVSLLDLGRLRDAAKLWRQALKSHPSHPEVTFNQGLMRWREPGSNFLDTQLVQALLAGRASSHGDWRYSYLLALTHLERGDCEAAYRALKSITPDGDNGASVAEARGVTKHLYPKSRRLLGRFKSEAVENHAVALSEDGRFAITGGDDGVVRQWDISQGRVLQELTGHRGVVHGVVISADGEVACSAGADQQIRVWQLSSGRCLRILNDHIKAVTALAISGDGRTLLSASVDTTVKLWQLESGRCLQTMVGHQSAILAVAMDDEATLAVSAGGVGQGRDHMIRVWDLATGKQIRAMEGHKAAIHALALDGTATRLVSGDAAGTVLNWDLTRGEQLVAIQGVATPVYGLVLSRDGRYAVAANGATERASGAVVIWDLQQRRCLTTLSGKGVAIRGVVLDRQCDALLACGDDHELALWQVRLGRYRWRAPLRLSDILGSDQAQQAAASYEGYVAAGEALLKEGEPVAAYDRLQQARAVKGYNRGDAAMALLERITQRLPIQGFAGSWEMGSMLRHEEAVTAVTVASSSDFILSGDGAGHIWLTSLKRRVEAQSLQPHKGSVESLSLSHDDRLLLSGGGDGVLHIYDLKSGERIRALLGHTSRVTAVKVLRHHRYGLSVSADGDGRLWDLATGECLEIYQGHDGPLLTMALAADERCFYAGGETGEIVCWDLFKPKPRHRFYAHEGQVYALASCADERLLLSSGTDQKLVVWRAEDGVILAELEGHRDFVRSLCLSSDGRFALTGSNDQSARLWDLATKQSIRTFEGHDNHLLAVALAGDVAITAGRDKKLKLWRLDWQLTRIALQPWHARAERYLENWLRRRNRLPLLDLGSFKGLLRRLFGRGITALDTQELAELRDLMSRVGMGWVDTTRLREEAEKRLTKWRYR